MNNGATVNTSGGDSTDTLTVGSTSGVAIRDNTNLTVGSAIVNAGTISLNSANDGTELRVAGGATVNLSGGGVVQLSDNPNNYIRDYSSNTGHAGERRQPHQGFWPGR